MNHHGSFRLDGDACTGPRSVRPASAEDNVERVL